MTYTLTVNFEPIDYNGSLQDITTEFTMIPFGTRDWIMINGVFRFDEDPIQGYITVDDQWLPAELAGIKVQRRIGADFLVGITVRFSTVGDEQILLELAGFTARFVGVTFQLAAERLSQSEVPDFVERLRLPDTYDHWYANGPEIVIPPVLDVER